MRRDEAVARAEQLNREHADRATHRWFPREDGSGAWTVARVAVGARLAGATGTAQAKPERTPHTAPADLPGGVPPYAAGG